MNTMKPIRSEATVYLAGPISGLTYDGAETWREEARVALAQSGIKALSPLRAKDYLRSIGEIDPIGTKYAAMGVLSTSRGVTTRDRYDATRCDVLLVNLLGAARVSIGTMFEIAWADLCRTPIVVMMEAEGNVHDHMMLREMTGFQVDSLDAALHVIKSIVNND